MVPHTEREIRSKQKPRRPRIETEGQQSEGNFDRAIRDFQLVSRKGWRGFRITCGYELSRSYYKIGKYDQAIEAVTRLQGIHSNFARWNVDAPLYILELAIYLPKSFYLLGKIYEKKGDTQLAIENYEKFLDLWKDADEDLPDLIDAKERLARLTPLDNREATTGKR